MTPRARRWGRVALLLAIALGSGRVVTPAWCGQGAADLYAGTGGADLALGQELVDFEARDDLARAGPPQDRFAGEWALVTHQMTALGLAQLALAHPQERARLAPEITRAALKSFRPEMRAFGTRAWQGEDAMASLAGEHGHSYLAYSALALGMARLLDPAFPPDVARAHDALVAAYERRLLASPTGLIETYPGQAFPTDVAAVAGAIAVHGRATGRDHAPVLARWASLVEARQLDPSSGLVVQRMDARTGAALDAPRGSGTALAAYFAGFADRRVARGLAAGALGAESTFWGFGAIREYAPGHSGPGDVDSGPVLLGVSVSATGFALAGARAHGERAAFERLYRTAALFGAPRRSPGRLHFAAGGPIGDALLLALLTSGPELAP